MLPYHWASILSVSLANVKQVKGLFLQPGTPEKYYSRKKFATLVCCKCSCLHAYHYLTGSGILRDARTARLSALQSHVRLSIWQTQGPDGVLSVQPNHVPAGLVAIRRLHSKVAAS